MKKLKSGIRNLFIVLLLVASIYNGGCYGQGCRCDINTYYTNHNMYHKGYNYREALNKNMIYGMSMEYFADNDRIEYSLNLAVEHIDIGCITQLSVIDIKMGGFKKYRVKNKYDDVECYNKKTEQLQIFIKLNNYPDLLYYITNKKLKSITIYNGEKHKFRVTNKNRKKIIETYKCFYSDRLYYSTK